jgi:hypothetical protein
MKPENYSSKNYTKKSFEKTIFVWICLGFLIIFTFTNLYWISTPPSKTKRYADRIIEFCESKNNKSTCYDTEIPTLMESPANLSMEESFEIVNIIQNKTNYQFCHVIGHKLASIETSKNPNDWKSIIARCPTRICSNGCLHGTFQEKFRQEHLSSQEIETIKPELLTICRQRPEWQPTNLMQGSCYHALGHLTMYITNADVSKALSLCSELAFSETNQDYRKICYDGVFMQIFQPLEPDDYELIKNVSPNRSSVEDFCRQFPNESFTSCWTESWPLFKEEVSNAKGATQFCSKLTGEGQVRCLNNIFYLSPIQLKFDIESILNYCNSFPQNLKEACFSQSGLRFIQSETGLIDNAIKFCRKSMQLDPPESCFKTIAANARHSFKNSELESFCRKLPQHWHSICTGVAQ